ncbi:hypothetical protein GCM10009566_66510 [Streptomyces murinus]
MAKTLAARDAAQETLPENAECPAVGGRQGGRQKRWGVRPQAADVPAELDVDVDDDFESDDAEVEVEPDDEEPDDFVAGLLLDEEPRESLR